MKIQESGRMPGTILRTLGCLALSIPVVAQGPSSKELKPTEGKITSLYPLAGQRGARFETVIRGEHLQGARALVFTDGSVTGRVLRVDDEPAPTAKATNQAKQPKQLLRAELSVAPEAVPGWHSFRIVTPEGMTNEIAMLVVDQPVLTPEGAQRPLRRFPIAVNGRIGRPGDRDTYWIEPETGQALNVQVVSGFADFDPTASLYEMSGSWFNANRLNRLAFSDDVVPYPGLPTDAVLSWRFNQPGKYCVKVEAFAGKGGPDYSYQMLITPSDAPKTAWKPQVAPDWDERLFTRKLNHVWLGALIDRSGAEGKIEAPETYRAAPEGTQEIPIMKMPGIVEGKITKPGETHVIRLELTKPENLVIEVETPETSLAEFDPVVRLLEPGGREMATDIYSKLNQGLDLVKMIEAKTSVALRAPGVYTLEIHDITADRAGDNFSYRVLVRRAIPHVGRVNIAPAQMNLEQGSARSLTVTIDREEGFQDFVVASVEGLPPGVTAVPAMDNPPLKLPSLVVNGGKPERYFAPDQTMSLLLVAAPDAPLSSLPVTMRVTLRTMVNGKIGQQVVAKPIPIMVVPRRAI